MLDKLHNHTTGFAGLAVGGGAIIAAATSMFRLVSDPNYLSALFVAIIHSREHAITPVDVHVYAQLSGSVISLLGAFAIALLLSYLGLPASAGSGMAAPQAAAVATEKDNTK